jgi:hypothetical protein
MNKEVVLPVHGYLRKLNGTGDVALIGTNRSGLF